MRALAVRNGMWNAAATSVMSVTTILGSVLVVRTFSPELYGTFSYYMWLAGIVIAGGTLAFPLSLTKMTSELIGEDKVEEAGALSFSVLILVFIVNLIIAIGLLVWAMMVPMPERGYLLVVTGIAVPSSFSGVALSILWGQQRYRPVSITLLIACAIQLGLLVLAFHQGWSVTGFMIAALSMPFINALGIFAIFVREVKRRTSLVFRLPTIYTARRYWAFLAPATLSHLITIVVWERSEVFFLERLSTMTQVGIYSLAYTAVALCLTLGWALLNAFYPAISSDYGAGRWNDVQMKFSQGTNLAMLYAAPITFGGLITLGGLFGVLYQDKMMDSVPVAQILIIGLVPGVIGSMLGITVGALGGMWLLVRLGVVVAIVNIVAALLLIPPFGAIGAAFANTGSQMVHVALLMIVVVWRYKLMLSGRTMTSIASIGFITTFLLPGAVQMVVPGFAGLVAAVALGGCAYLLAVWSLGFLTILQPPAMISAPSRAQST